MNLTSLQMDSASSSITYTPAFLVMQVFFAASMFIGCLLSYLGPIWYFEKITQRNRTSTVSAENVIAYCNCFGAGIFVAICFLGMLPVVQQEFHSYFQSRGIDHVDYPVAELFSLIGFFLVLFLEEMVHFCRNRSTESHLEPVLYLDDVSMESDSNHSLLPPQERTSGAMSVDDFEELKLEEPEVRTIRLKSHHHIHHQNNHHQMSHVHSHSHLPPATSSSFTFFVLMFATSIHSICEGLALGLIKERSRAIHLFIGIILHECIVAAALGLSFVKMENRTPSHGQDSSNKNYKFGLLFSSTVPIGIIMGIFIGYTPGSLGKLISAIFQALAAGTFIHVAFCELIPAELSHTPSSICEAPNSGEEKEEPLESSHSHGDHSLHFERQSVRTSDDERVESDEHLQRSEFTSSSKVVALREKRVFRILLIFLGFIFMAVITVFIDH